MRDPVGVPIRALSICARAPSICARAPSIHNCALSAYARAPSVYASMPLCHVLRARASHAKPTESITWHRLMCAEYDCMGEQVDARRRVVASTVSAITSR